MVQPAIRAVLLNLPANSATAGRRGGRRGEEAFLGIQKAAAAETRFDRPGLDAVG